MLILLSWKLNCFLRRLKTIENSKAIFMTGGAKLIEFIRLIKYTDKNEEMQDYTSFMSRKISNSVL